MPKRNGRTRSAVAVTVAHRSGDRSSPDTGSRDPPVAFARCVRRLAWPIRFVCIVLAGALLVAGVVIGVAPRLWRVAERARPAPGRAAGVPAAVATLATCTTSQGNVIDVYERENSQPIKLAQVPPDVINALARGRGQRVLHPPRGQRAQLHARPAVELLQRRAAPGRQHDHPAGGEERVPRRPRPRRAVQGVAGALRHDAREGDVQGRHPRALPEHGVLRQQRLRAAGRGRGVLRQERRAADDGRGSVPRRPGALAVGLRPVPPARAGQGAVQAGRRPPRRRRHAHPGAGRRPRRRTTRCPSCRARCRR